MSYIPQSIVSNSSRGQADWSDELAWYPNSRLYTPEHCYTFNQTDKDLFFDQCPYNLAKEKVYSLEFYKTPLSRDHIERAPPGWQYKLVHVYVIVKCCRTSFCFAKTCSDIDVICAHSSDVESLHENQYQLNAPSRSYTRVQGTGPYMLNVKHIVEWIFDSGQITSGYNSFTNNCKDFAVALFNNFSHYGHVSPWYGPSGPSTKLDTWF